MTLKKRTGRIIYENGTGKKIVGHSKLKLWTFFWGHGECEWPLVLEFILMFSIGIFTEDIKQCKSKKSKLNI